MFEFFTLEWAMSVYSYSFAVPYGRRWYWYLDESMS